VLLAAVLFGTTGTAKALGPDGADPYVTGAMRLLVGGPLLLAAARLQARPGPKAVSPPGWAVAAGGLCVAVYQFGFFAGLDRVGVAGGTVIAIGSGPVFAGVISAVALRETPSRAWVIATAVAVAGVTLIGVADGSTRGRLDEHRTLGIVLVLVAGFGYAAYTVLARWAVHHGVDGQDLIGRAFTLGGVLLATSWWWRPSSGLGSPGGAALVLYLGVVPTFVAYRAFATGLRVLDGPTVTTFVLAEPATAVVLASIVLSEHLDRVAWTGIGLIAAAMAVLAVRTAHDGGRDPR
jgi:DME family drug/metabolite transporter